jgi:hypothetical protein
MIASLNSVWLQQQVRCDCKKACTMCVYKYFVCVIAKHCWLFYDWKKTWAVSVCNYFVCVIANNTSNFMIAKKSLNSVCLQLFCVCDCNQKLCVVAKPDCVCVVKSTWLFGYLWLQAWIVQESWSKKLKCFFIRLWCRKVGQTREDRDGDIEKLFQFFRSLSRTMKYSTGMLILTQRQKC